MNYICFVISFYQYVVSLLAPNNTLYLKSILPDINIATLVFFWLTFALNIFFNPITFKLSTSSYFRCVSYK